MSDFICLTLPLFLKQLLKLILLPHLFNPLYKPLLLPLFHPLLIYLLLFHHLMIILDKKYLFLEFLLFLLQFQELSVFHLLQVLTQELALGALAGELGFAVWEHDAFARTLTQLLKDESFKGF